MTRSNSDQLPRFAVPRSAYVHIPFCRHRCGYCNFTLVSGRDDLIEPFLAALAQELASLGAPPELDTLYLGGGTPTYPVPAQFAALLQTIVGRFRLAPGYEFTVEANPSDLTKEKTALMRQFGVNRLSLGVQSFAPDKLRFLERDHDAAQVGRAFALAREAGLATSLDLIFGIPDETLSDWDRDLDLALSLQPQHVSCYGLTIERGAAFYGRWNRQRLCPASEETQAELYERAIDRLVAAGYEHYEVSNFGLPGHRSRHNEVYWRGRTYYAAGPGAARYVAGRREVNHRSTTTYIRRIESGQSPVAESESLSPEASARERLVFGLRRLAGVERREFVAETGFTIDELVGPRARAFTTAGLLHDDGMRLRLTRRGLLISDALWSSFLEPTGSG